MVKTWTRTHSVQYLREDNTTTTSASNGIGAPVRSATSAGDRHLPHKNPQPQPRPHRKAVQIDHLNPAPRRLLPHKPLPREPSLAMENPPPPIDVRRLAASRTALSCHPSLDLHDLLGLRCSSPNLPLFPLHSAMFLPFWLGEGGVSAPRWGELLVRPMDNVASIAPID